MLSVWRSALCAVVFALAFPVGAQEFRILQGHGGPIMDTAISPDGRHALTASFDNSVGYWNLDTDTVHWLEGHNAAVKRVLFVGNDLAASAGDDFAIEIWDLKTATHKFRLEGHLGQVMGLAASEDRSVLASASWDGTVRLWDLTNGGELAVLEGHTGGVNDVAFATGGKTLFSASADGTIRRWDADRRIIDGVVVRHGFGVTRLLVNQAAGWLAYGAVDGRTRVLSLADDSPVEELTWDRRPILALAASPAMDQIAVGDGEGYITVIDTAEWDVLYDFRAAKNGPIWALSYAHDGQNLLAGGIDDEAYFWPLGDDAGGPLMASTERGFLRDPETMSNGERQFRRKCSICHSLTVDGGRRAGPTLFGLFGRRAGTVDGYPYSQTISDLDIVWSESTIDKLFDLGPDHYVPGSKMPMQRIASPQDRNDLIEFLKDNTKG